MMATQRTPENEGLELGFYSTLEAIGYAHPSEISRRCSVPQEIVDSWLNERRSGGWLDFEPSTGTYSLGCAWPPIANRAYDLDV